MLVLDVKNMCDTATDGSGETLHRWRSEEQGVGRANAEKRRSEQMPAQVEAKRGEWGEFETADNPGLVVGVFMRNSGFHFLFLLSKRIVALFFRSRFAGLCAMLNNEAFANLSTTFQVQPKMSLQVFRASQAAVRL